MPYCQIIADLYTENGGLNPLEMAKKLSTYFRNLEDIKNYLKTVNYDTKKTIELSFQFNLPRKLSSKTLEFFQTFNKSGRDSLYIFSNAHLLEKTEEFQKILKENNLKKLVNQITEIVIKESYKYNEEELSEENKLHAKNLANSSLKGKLDNNSFQKALNFIKEDYMPDINFDIEVKGKKYNFSKLPADDMRGFMLGKFSNSCQSMGNNSERCVLDGMSKANVGFYIITDDKGNIRAQSYAWLAGEGKKNEKATSMVLDSFEHLGKEDKLLFVPIINKLREALQKQALNLYLGCGGQTPKLDINTIPNLKPIEQDLYIYGDAKNVYPITTEVPTIELNLGKNAHNPVNQYSTIEELKVDSKLLQQIIMSKQINRDLIEEEMLLLNIGFTFE